MPRRTGPPTTPTRARLVVDGPAGQHQLHPRQRAGEHRDVGVGPGHRRPRHRHREVDRQRRTRSTPRTASTTGLTGHRHHPGHPGRQPAQDARRLGPAVPHQGRLQELHRPRPRRPRPDARHPQGHDHRQPRHRLGPLDRRDSPARGTKPRDPLPDPPPRADPDARLHPARGGRHGSEGGDIAEEAPSEPLELA